MGLKLTKGEVFGLISSCRTLLENYPKLSDIKSFTSINNSTDQLEFIVDLFKALGSIDDLIEVIGDIIIKQLDYIETSIKQIIKTSILENISCNINPSIVDELFNNGINVEIKDFDIFSLMKKHPLSHNGELYYFDINYSENILYKSKDFNAFLWYIININDSNINNKWGVEQNVYSNNLIQITFIENDEILGLNNFINIKIDPFYKNNSTELKLNEFNSNFVDSIQFFNKKNVMVDLFNRVFNSSNLSSNLNKNEIQLQEEINVIIDRITQCGGEEMEIIDDYFAFSNDEYNNLLELTNKKRMGLIPNISIPINVSSNDIANALNGFDNESTLIEQSEKFTSALSEIVNNVSNSDTQLNDSDKYNFKISLLRNMIKELSSLMTLTIMSPKIYLLMLINIKLMGGDNKNINPIDFIKNNINLVSSIVTNIKDEVVGILVDKIMQMATNLAFDMTQQMVMDKMLMHKKYLQTLIDYTNQGVDIRNKII